MSNIDNLGATVDIGILNMCISRDHEFVMEVRIVIHSIEIFVFKNLLKFFITFLLLTKIIKPFEKP